MCNNNINVVAFDADDTLWVNEPLFQEKTNTFCSMLSGYGSPEEIGKQFEEIQKRNLPIFGYGIKGFTLSMMETALEVSKGGIGGKTLEGILNMGKSMHEHPVRLLDGVKSTLHELNDHFKVMLITKGDLVEQERKLSLSGLSNCFHCVEIVSEKNEVMYEQILAKHSIAHDRFLMVGNSLKSDILPVVRIGGNACHIPFHTTWLLEQVEPHDIQNINYMELNHIHELPDSLSS